MDRPESVASKTVWRQWARSVAVDPVAVSAAVVEALDAFLDAGTIVLGFLPMPDEVDLRPLYAFEDRTWLVTRTPAEGPLTVHSAASPLEVHDYGFAQPVAGSTEVDPTAIDAVLVPGVVFDRSGGRLGRGMGYYDEVLTRCRPDVTRIGVTVDALVVPAVPMEPHDLAMTHLVTDSGVTTIQ
ncbi:MAG: 5-formyltetrahydrofolate cyclo-ligase [Acidimicrobiia bacterium]|nr:5-formyltetrahydrofolate cyclo-ligase [Acidimicrobiia bacterium]